MPPPNVNPAVIPLLSLGFRPFFLAAGLWAVVAMLLWLPILLGSLTLPLAVLPVDWHAHEMLFGYAVAVVAGFLLTAVPNWTGRPPLSGVPLALLALLWLAGRLAMAVGDWLGAGLAAAIDGAFLPVLLILISRELIAVRNWRNLPVMAALAGLAGANLWFHGVVLGDSLATGDALRMGTAVLTLLIVLIGGRIVPNFTRNWLKQREPAGPLPPQFSTIDGLATALTTLALVNWVIAPGWLWTATTMVIAAGLLLLRLARWQGHRTLAEPLVTILHIGYLWVPLGLLQLAASIVWSTGGFGTAAHGLLAGAVGTMTLAVMTRASLGHSGLPLHAGRGTVAIFVFVSLAAVARVLAWALPAAYTPLLHSAALGWMLAFGLFVVLYGPLMLRPRR